MLKRAFVKNSICQSQSQNLRPNRTLVQLVSENGEYTKLFHIGDHFRGMTILRAFAQLLSSGKNGML